MNDPVELARKRLAEIEQEAEKLKLFLASWESVQDLLTPTTQPTVSDVKAVDKEPSKPKLKISFRAVNPPTEKVVEAAIVILRQRGHPMTRRALHKALADRGIEVKGTDPVKTLGTILWRAKDKLIQLEGYGYWPADLSYGRANYLRPQEKIQNSLKDLI